MNIKIIIVSESDIKEDEIHDKVSYSIKSGEAEIHITNNQAQSAGIRSEQSWFQIYKIDTGFNLDYSYEYLSINSDVIVMWQDQLIYISLNTQNIAQKLYNSLDVFSEKQQSIILEKYPYNDQNKLDIPSRFTIICVSSSLIKIKLKKNQSICIIQNGVTVYITDINNTLHLKSEDEFEMHDHNHVIMYKEFTIKQSVAVFFYAKHLFLNFIEHKKAEIIPFLKTYQSNFSPEQQLLVRKQSKQGVKDMELYQMNSKEAAELIRKQKLEEILLRIQDNGVEEEQLNSNDTNGQQEQLQSNIEMPQQYPILQQQNDIEKRTEKIQLVFSDSEPEKENNCIQNVEKPTIQILEQMERFKVQYHFNTCNNTITNDNMTNYEKTQVKDQKIYKLTQSQAINAIEEQKIDIEEFNNKQLQKLHQKSALVKEQKLQKLAKAQIDNAVEEQAQQKIYIVEQEQQEIKGQNMQNDVAQLKKLQEKALNFSDSEIDEVQETQIQQKTKQSVETSESDVVLEEEDIQKQSHVSELIDVDDSIKTDHMQYIVPLKDVEQFFDELLTTENIMFIDSSQSIIDTQQNIFSICKDDEQDTIKAVYVCQDTQSKFYANPYILFGVYHCIPIVTQKDKQSLQLKYRTKHKRIQFALYSDLKMKNMKPSAKPKICEEMQLLKAIEISMASINRMQLFVTQATVQKHFKLIEKVHGWEHVHKWSDLNFNYKVWSLEDLASFIFLDKE
ncbi:Hypothetical_protein [Hexamita inflata]|uniref:Hypothetical_protein n=1 Tax=Hexamita inflata TaxID=28002 RepID=A0AA86PBH4_9EUKA|nr:Hypothetical protein HINF_LOCUS23128 [Hexamita inflata]